MHKKRLAVGGMMGVIVLTILVLDGSGAFATQTCTTDSNTGIETCVDPENGTTYSRTSSITASVSVGVGSCTFDRDSSTSGSYTGTLANGATPEPISGSIFEIKCNDGGGSSIYAIGYSNDEITNTDLISSLGSSTNIHTGVYDSTAATHDSSWAMKMQTASGGYSGAVASFGDFADFQEIPSSYTLVASYPSSTIDPTGTVTSGGKVQAVYQAYASYTQPAGTYTGQVKYTMIHPNSITPIKLISDLEYLQDFATLTEAEKTSVISFMDTGVDYILKDARDEQEYTLAKLDDGRVWMTKNLNIAGGEELSSADTDFDSNYTLPTTDGWTTIGDNNEKLVLPDSALKNADNNDLTDRTQFSANNYAYVFNSGSTTNCGASGQDTPCYSYYSWDTATLGSGRTISVRNQNAPYSICPKGWKLPSTYDGSGTAAENTDFRALMIALGGSNSRQSYNDSTLPKGSELYALFGPGTIPNFLLAGDYYNGLFQNATGGFYWTSTSVATSSGAYTMRFGSSLVNLATLNHRRVGEAIRCVVTAL